jgi:hypothetical protein
MIQDFVGQLSSERLVMLVGLVCIVCLCFSSVDTVYVFIAWFLCVLAYISARV